MARCFRSAVEQYKCYFPCFLNTSVYIQLYSVLNTSHKKGPHNDLYLSKVQLHWKKKIKWGKKKKQHSNINTSTKEMLTFSVRKENSKTNFNCMFGRSISATKTHYKQQMFKPNICLLKDQTNSVCFLHVLSVKKPQHVARMKIYEGKKLK